MNAYRWHRISLIATVGGVGYAPKVPGTVGSLVGLGLGAAVMAYMPTLFWPLFALLLITGVRASAWVVEHWRQEDPKAVVIDEVVGQWLPLPFIPLELWAYALAFALFRFFDIVKPWPVSWADKKVKGGLGIMLDDILAGFYTIIMLLLIQSFL